MKKLFVMLICALAGYQADAQVADMTLIPIVINRDVTTHIVMPEAIRLVDISTNSIAGNQCAENIVRIKPANDSVCRNANGIVGTVTVIGERHMAQFNVYIASSPKYANPSYFVKQYEMTEYTNPDVAMTKGDMARISRAVFASRRKFFNIHASAYGMKVVVNNIYTMGDKFFLDFSLYNKTKIKYDIDEIRIKLTDKKEAKATNSQTVELTPCFSLNNARSFKKAYRNVIVIDKLTFPDEKVLRLEVSENQISGRVISVPIDYSDILNADCIDDDLMRHLTL